jgi:hypothetical protein
LDEEHSLASGFFLLNTSRAASAVFHPSGHPEDVHQDLLKQITTASAGLHGR